MTKKQMYHRAYYRAHAEQEAEYNKKYRQKSRRKMIRYSRAYYNAHSDRLKNSAQKYRIKNRTKIRDRKRESNSGWTAEMYAAAFTLQKGRCAVCRKRSTLVPDHDHDSLRTRELLCNTCNTGLGLFMDNPSFIEAAARYLRKHGK